MSKYYRSSFHIPIFILVEQKISTNENPLESLTYPIKYQIIITRKGNFYYQVEIFCTLEIKQFEVIYLSW